jgi:hypothetical protein
MVSTETRWKISTNGTGTYMGPVPAIWDVQIEKCLDD